MQIEWSFGLWALEISNASTLVIEMDGLEWRVDNPLIGIEEWFKTNLTKSYKFPLPPNFNNNFITICVDSWSVMRKYIDMLSVDKMWNAKLNSLLGQWDFVAARSTYWTEITDV